MLLNLPEEILVMILNNLTFYENKCIITVCQTIKRIIFGSKNFARMKLEFCEMIKPFKYNENHLNFSSGPNLIPNRFEIHNSNKIEFHGNDSNIFKPKNILVNQRGDIVNVYRKKSPQNIKKSSFRINDIKKIINLDIYKIINLNEIDKKEFGVRNVDVNKIILVIIKLINLINSPMKL